MPQPTRPPIGLHLAQTAKQVSRAFDDTLAAAGGSLPQWLILLAVKTRAPDSQRALADAVGIRGATLTHHLHTLEADGLVERTRDPDNLRVQFVDLTPAGEERFLQLRRAAVSFDERLRRGMSDADIGRLTKMLSRLADNVRRPE